MLDLTDLLVPKCITCGSAPVITQRESMEKTAEDDYTEWKPSGSFVLEVECPKCGRFCQTFAMKQEHVDQDPNLLEKYGWTKKYHTFVGCQSGKDDYQSEEEYFDDSDIDNGCADNEGVVCEECPHWGTSHCSKCGCSQFEFARRCTPEDDALNYEKKCMWKCAKCGDLIRVWNF